MADQVIVVPTPINPVQIKGAIAFSAEHARIWAEGTDEQVEELGGEHSAKGWAESTGEEGREYTDQKVAEAKQEMTDEINRQSLLTLSQAESYADASVSSEAGLRVAADANLQSQIDGLAAASDVKDIVGTYAELQSYDTSTLGDNDIIKVLDDSTHGDAPSYYRWDKDTSTFSYIGSESASYTKSQADSKFLTKTDAASTYVDDTELSTALADKASNADGTTITDSGSAISTVAVKEQRASTPIKQWVGTKAQYTALESKDSNTIYVITDETDVEAITVDSALSATSIHPVQNKVITEALQNIDALPSQTGQAGKFLTTDGTEASWATVQGGSGASFLSGGAAPTSGTNADMAGQTYVNTTDGSLYVCQALTGGDPTTYYTVVGTPTINSSYVASNFGSNSYVDTGVTFRPSGAWNIKMKFNCSALSSSWYKLTGHTGNSVSIGVDNKKIKLECSSTGSGWDVCAFTCSTEIQLSRDYWIDFGFDGTNTYYVDLSTDGVTYTRDGSATSTKKVYSTATMGLGCAFSGYDSHYFVGSIYLTDFGIYEATELTYRAVSLGGPLWKSATESLKTITGYNASATQALKNVNGVLTWVNEA